MRSMELAATLLDWYLAQRRLLPWRETRDPYRVWVSEVMLQQTQVQTVIPFYERFLARFPTVGELAESELDEVLALWSGLGYYRRARFMHRAARGIVASGGRFPSSYDELLELPGVGAYTAAAVASIAYDEVVPVLDGNVERVLCRRLGFDQDPKLRSSRRVLSTVALELLVEENPGDSNQALMELGATICRPRNPKCEVCPLNAGCVGYLSGDPELYPLRRQRQATAELELAVAVVLVDRRILLFRRPETEEILSGLWELPNVYNQPDLLAVQIALGDRYGGRWRLSDQGLEVRHNITFRALSLRVFSASFQALDSVSEGPEAAWVPRLEISKMAVSSMVLKVLAKFLSGGGS